MQAEVRIERYADQGRCVAHIDGRVVFVRFALPDELVRVELDEPHDRDDRFWTGEVVEVLEPSEDRVTRHGHLPVPWRWAGEWAARISCTSLCPASSSGRPSPSPNR